MTHDKVLSKNEVFTLLMRRLNNIIIQIPRCHAEPILYIISQLENLHYFPNDIRKQSDYSQLTDEDVIKFVAENAYDFSTEEYKNKVLAAANEKYYFHADGSITER